MTSPAPKRVALVGHCRPDVYALKSALESAAPGMRIDNADDDQSLADVLPGADLLLINRILDGHFADRHGLALIRDLAPETNATLMLVSNHDDAQAEAESHGAVPGFGKAALYDAETKRRIRAALQLDEDS